jgi:hypothetical protein
LERDSSEINWAEDWVGPRAGMDAIPATETQPSGPQPATVLTKLLKPPSRTWEYDIEIYF